MMIRKLFDNSENLIKIKKVDDWQTLARSSRLQTKCSSSVHCTAARSSTVGNYITLKTKSQWG
jgi:hypothetical protein